MRCVFTIVMTVVAFLRLVLSRRLLTGKVAAVDDVALVVVVADDDAD